MNLYIYNLLILLNIFVQSMFVPKTTKQSIEIHVKHPREIKAQNLLMKSSGWKSPKAFRMDFHLVSWGWVFVVGWSFVVKGWWFLSIIFWFDFVSLRFVYQVVNVFFAFEWGEVMKKFGWKCKNRFLFVGMDLVKISTSNCDWLQSINIEKTRCSNNHVAANTALVGKDLLEVC